MKKLILTFSATLLGLSMYSQIYIADSCRISFFSATPVENIDATNKAAKPILNTSTGDIQIKIANAGFVFPKPLMQEHFNENYMESEKFPNTIFKGKINEKIDYKVDGTNNVTVTGKMDMHGTVKDITIKGVIIVKGEQITIQAKFNVHVADYNIQIPTLVVKNIAEDVAVMVNATLKPYKKK